MRIMITISTNRRSFRKRALEYNEWDNGLWHGILIMDRKLINKGEKKKHREKE